MFPENFAGPPKWFRRPRSTLFGITESRRNRLFRQSKWVPAAQASLDESGPNSGPL